MRAAANRSNIAQAVVDGRLMAGPQAHSHLLDWPSDAWQLNESADVAG
jgi:hypothetical protein